MLIEINFSSDEAIYSQLVDQIIVGIATEEFHEGDALPSVRQLADMIGINMHTVNKAYGVLQQQGFVRIDRRRGAVIAVDVDKLRALDEAENILKIVFARTHCRGVTRSEVHELVDRIYDKYDERNGMK